MLRACLKLMFWVLCSVGKLSTLAWVAIAETGAAWALSLRASIWISFSSLTIFSTDSAGFLGASSWSSLTRWITLDNKRLEDAWADRRVRSVSRARYPASI